MVDGEGRPEAAHPAAHPAAFTTPVHTTMLANRVGADRAAADQLMARVYDRLRRRAELLVAGDRAGRDLGPTALVHAAYEKLYLHPGGRAAYQWASSGQFRAAFARAMQRVLIDHARTERRAKRGGGRGRVDLRSLDAVALYGGDPGLILDVHQAFRLLAKAHPACHAVAVHRVYGGLTIGEAAAELGVSEKTVDRRWAMAQAFLKLALGDGGDAPAMAAAAVAPVAGRTGGPRG